MKTAHLINTGMSVLIAILILAGGSTGYADQPGNTAQRPEEAPKSDTLRAKRAPDGFSSGKQFLPEPQLLDPGMTPNLSREQQQRIAGRVRSASRLEARGDYESALMIWRKLTTDQPDNSTYFMGTIRCLTALGLYDDAASALEERISGDVPGTDLPVLYAELGSVHYLAGREGQAEIDWRQAIDAIPGSASGYREVARVLIRLRLLDRADEILLQARKNLDDPNLFAMNLATLRQSRMNWIGAAEEYLRALAASRSQDNYVRRSLVNFPDEETANRAVEDAVNIMLRETESREPWPGYRDTLLDILAEQKMKNGDYDGAVNLLTDLASRGELPWRHLVSFASEAQADGALDAAERAIRTAREYTVSAMDRGELDLNLASISASAGRFAEADSLLSLYCASTGIPALRPRALLERGRLRFDRLNDPDAALDDFTALLKMGGSGSDLDYARYSAAKALIRLDRLEKADSLLALVGKATPERRGVRFVVRTRESRRSLDSDAAFLRARLLLWRGKSEQAARLLDRLLFNPTGQDPENDALALLKVIQDATSDSAGLVLFAKGDRAEFNHDYATARLAFEAAATDSAALAAEASWRLVLLSLTLDNPETPEIVERFTQSYPDHPRAEEALLNLGQWLEERGDPDRAVVCYENLLLDFPDGLLAGEARLRLDNLAGSNPTVVSPDSTLQP